MKGFVYCMVCPDMPHLFKIGRTVSAYQRMREANSHDTFKPPGGYTFLHVVLVPDMVATEAALHAQFAAVRRKNPQGHASEFFAADAESVGLAFAAVVGDRLDVSGMSQAAESAENAQTRLLLRAATVRRPAVYVHALETLAAALFVQQKRAKHARAARCGRRLSAVGEGVGEL